MDAYLKAHQEHTGADLSADFHNYRMEWNEHGIKTFIDNTPVLDFNFDQDMFDKGGFPQSVFNPWQYETPAKRKIAPFDQNFFLVLNVAVGGTNGYFPDGQCGKPWSNTSPTAVNEFYNAKAQWYPTWNYPATHDSAMQIRSVKVTQTDDDEEI